MRFSEPLIPARLLRRYKRFLADAELADGSTVIVHCPNPGAMLGLDAPGSEIWLSRAQGVARKLPYTWEMIRVGPNLVGINTGHPNGLVAEAVRNGQIPALEGYARLRREVNYGRSSRIDILLEDEVRPPCYIEVKNVHLRRSDAAEFPDCVTARGAKHLDELSAVVAAGARAAMVYLVQREDCTRFAIAADIDPTYAAAFKKAHAVGVEMMCHACQITSAAIEVGQPLPIDL